MPVTERRGTVWYGARRVGDLRADDEGRLWLRYTAEWLEHGFPVSISLPLSRDGAMDAHAFFAGLLPEGQARARLCREHRLKLTDDAGLLLQIGRDCAGALQILPIDEGPDDEAASTPRPLSDEDFEQLITSQGRWLPADTPQRFSLAGAQDKVALVLEGSPQRRWLPDARHPSTHIIKFDGLRWTCLAEWFANRLADHFDLGVPTTEFRRLDDDEGTPYLEIERYDRERIDEQSWRRIHQEDLAQALGVPSSQKYEQDGGPSLARIVELVRQISSDPITDVARLRDWQLFNYLVGNWDGHAKNLALLYPADGAVPRLAPFYDLICVELFHRIRSARFERSLALLVGGESAPEGIGRRDWEAEAKALHLPARKLLARLEELALALPEAARQTEQAFAGEHGDAPVFEQLLEIVDDRCKWVLGSVLAGQRRS